MSIAHRRGKWRRNWSYWHYGANVYPDGLHDDWAIKHHAHGYVTMEPCDDHLNARAEPWDGHTQGHCGEHISIFGRDRELVAAAFERRLAEAIARQDGACHDRFHKHRGAADGVNVYEVSWYSRVRRRGEQEIIELPCGGQWEHDWGGWSEWRKVQDDPPFYNCQRICKRCIQVELWASSNPAPAGASGASPATH